MSQASVDACTENTHGKLIEKNDGVQKDSLQPEVSKRCSSDFYFYFSDLKLASTALQAEIDMNVVDLDGILHRNIWCPTKVTV